MATNYVKFNRGSAIAFQNLITKNSDTLYFITDSDNNRSQLYLGDKLIAGGITELNELNDIKIIEALEENQILIFDAEQEKWINKGLIEAIGVMSGATATEQGSSGLVPAPGINYQDKFLRGDGNWVEIETGSYYFGDEKTIESNGVIFSLKDFEKKYYAYIPASGSEEEGNFIAAHYEACEVDETHPWKENLEPKVVKENDVFVLGWFEPNPMLLDGVIDELSSLQNQINKSNEFIVALQKDNGAINSKLEDKADKASVYTKEETETRVNELISNAQHLIRKIFDTIEEAEEFIAKIDNPTDYVYMIKNTSATASDKYTEYLYIDNELELVGSWDVNLDNYVTDNELLLGLSSKVSVEQGKTLIATEDIEKLATIESGAEKNFISSIDNTVFDVTEGKLELKTLSISNVDNLENLLNNKAETSEISALQNAISTNTGSISGLTNKITTVEENIVTLTNSVSDITELLNSSYLTQEAFNAEMELIDNELNLIKESITWVTLG